MSREDTQPGEERETGEEVPGFEGPVAYGGAALAPHLLINRPFLWLILGELVAGVAFWAFLSTTFADAVYKFDASEPAMALLGASLSVPFVLFIPLQGILVDRWSPKWLSFIGYVVLAAAIPVAWSATSMVNLYASALLVGLAFAAIEPARSALTGLMIQESKLIRANGMISATFQTSLIVGTLIGSVMLAKGSSHALYQVAFGFAVCSLVFQVLIPDLRQGGERPALNFRDLGQGFRTTWRLPDLRLLVFVTGLGWMMVSAFWVLEPRFIQEALHQGEHAVPLLWTAHGLGAIVGATILSRIREPTGSEPRYVSLGVVFVGLGILIYVAPGVYAIAFLGAAFMGGGITYIFAPLMALIQRRVGEEQRGRVTSVFAAMQEGMGVGAAVFILVTASFILVRPTLIVAGLIALVTGLAGIRASTSRLEPAGDD